MAPVAQLLRTHHRVSHLQDLIDDLAPFARSGARLEAEQFAQRFRDAKAALELSDDELADRIRVSRPTIGRWARGETAPHPIGMPAVFRALVGIGKKKLKLNSPAPAL